MLLTIPGVIPKPQLERIGQLLVRGEFKDGKLSAGREAQRVKSNQELVQEPDLYTALNNLLMGCLIQNPIYQQAVLPRRIAAPYYARYTAGMRYGDHIDDPIMGAGADQYRSDVSITVFLSDPGDYEGGELVIRSSYGEQCIKLNAGDAVLYPSSSLHHINEVTQGERRVAVTWAQSLVRDPGQRELLYQLCQAREKLLVERPDSEETAWISNSYANLVRMWSEL
ncbi:MAG: Fe2+-dependent dioxygenase [Gammaproteobacteria bacterium]|nr:Fe2+-dependent dioxygenase [Gammaproteobacteria bacterium]